MGTAFLEGGFETPAFHEVRHDLLSRLRLVGGEDRFGRPFARGVAGEHPANRQGRRAAPIPPGGATAQLQRAFSFAIPLEGEALPHRVRVMQHLLEGGKPRAYHAGTPNGVETALRSWLVQHGIQTTGRNQGDVLASAVDAEFQDAVSPISQQLDRNGWQPPPQQTHDLLDAQSSGFVADPQLRADLWSSGQHTQKGQCPPLLGPGYAHDDSQHDPPESWAA